MKWLRFTLIGCFFALLSTFWLFPQAFHIVYAKNFIFKPVSAGLYSSVKLSSKQSLLIKEQREVAGERIENFWGSKQGNAAIFYCDDVEIYQRLCHSSKGSGCSVITPFGSWIILNYSGMSEDVIAHEMCHDELSARIGWWRSRTSVPKWLDEGLALQLDNRFVSSSDSIQRYIDYKAELQSYSMGNQVTIPLEKLETDKQFFGNDAAFTQLAYLTSAVHVAKMISVKGRKKVLDEVLQEK